MLIAFEKLDGTLLEGSDGTVGTIKDILFDGDQWEVRYLVVDTGSWLPGRKVLLSPTMLEAREWGRSIATVRQTQQQVKDSPEMDLAKPVSRQMEIELAEHYHWPVYWGAGIGSNPVPSTSHVSVDAKKEIEEELPNLRSADEVKGYRIKASDGEVGHVEDFVVDDEAWTFRYVVVDTRNWLPGRKVLVSPTWIEAMHWSDRTIGVNLARDAIRESPRYDPSEPINRRYEEHLYDYYGRQRYWA